MSSKIDIEHLIDYEDYYILKENKVYKFIIQKKDEEIIKKYKKYGIKFNINDFFILTKLKLNTIDEFYNFANNIFEEKKVTIEHIIINNTIKLLLNIIVFNKPKYIEIILLYNDNKENKDLIINEIINKYNNIIKDINSIKKDFKILKKEIEKLDIKNNNSNIKEKLILKKWENNLNIKLDINNDIGKNKSKEKNSFLSIKKNNIIKNNDIIKKKYEKEILLYYKFQCEEKPNTNIFAINKNWIENWKKMVNYDKISKNFEKFDEFINLYEKNEISDKTDNNLGEIKNKEILIDINSFLNDGDEKNNENKILKEKFNEKICEELWESFKKYGYDIEINSEIINNSNRKKKYNIIFLYNNKDFKEILKFNSIIYLDNENSLIQKIVNCLNSKNNLISKEICKFYNYNKFEVNNFICNKINGGGFVLSFIKSKNVDNL